MAAADATVYAVKGQAYRVKGWINNATTGNGIAAGIAADITDLAATITKDDATAVSTTNVPVQVAGQAGRWYLDLTAAEMGYYNLGIVVSCSNADQMEAKIDIICLDMSESGTRAPAQAVIRFEQFWKQMFARWFNRNTINRETAAYTVYDDADSTALYTGTSADDGTTGTMGKLS